MLVFEENKPRKTLSCIQKLAGTSPVKHDMHAPLSRSWTILIFHVLHHVGPHRVLQLLYIYICLACFRGFYHFSLETTIYTVNHRVKICIFIFTLCCECKENLFTSLHFIVVHDNYLLCFFILSLFHFCLFPSFCSGSYFLSLLPL